MARRKLERFAQISQREHILEEGKPLYSQIKGQWNSKLFLRDAPIVLELACGRGEYTVGLAQVLPLRNYIGVDIKGDRIWKGSTQAIELGINNVGFLRTHIQNLENFFQEGEVSEIWVVHPDPRPKNADARRRLTCPRFMAIYRKLLCKDGWVRLKTDNKGLFEYTLEVLKNEKIKNLELSYDLDQSPLLAEHYGIQTRYELMFKAEGAKIHYLKFQFA